MLTKFGKELRKLRLDRDELLKDMAQKLNVTVAYLSAVENGKRRIPDNWISIIEREYELNRAQTENMRRLAFEECNSISIDVENAGMQGRNLAFSFARRFSDLSSEDMKKLQEILERNDV